MSKKALLLASCLMSFATGALAQTAAAANDEQDEIVVTAVARGQDRLSTSISTSSLSADDLLKASPRSTAELFRSLPGIRSESSGGEGNANIAVRGLPVASGGAKFLQLQEDGLPILEFGDITFGNADIFLRADFNVARVESVRGGSASTFASNSPGGVINFISNTGETEGGAVQASTGLDYDEYRLDFRYGASLSENTRFHIGGFYRQGEGPRAAGYQATRGGQLKFNLTREFEGGYVRLYGKYLDDRAIGYLPNPVRVTGSNDSPSYANLSNFSLTSDTLHSRNFTRNITLDGANNPTTTDIRDGMRPLVKSVGLEAAFELGGGWEVQERFRFSAISGSFTSPFPANVDSASNILNALGGPGAKLSYANGPNAGQGIANPALLNGNGLIAQIVLFDTRLNSLDNVTNDLRLTRDFAVGGGDLSVTAGWYFSNQTIDTDWLWTSQLMEVVGGGNAALLDVTRANGTAVTQDGFYGFGAAFFGNCCRRSYDLQYRTNAPFAAFSWDGGALTLDASFRYDFGRASGSVTGADLGGGRVGVGSYDFNRNGVISEAEARTSILPLGRPAPVDYGYDYLSYSLGTNYRINDGLAVFARYSRGARANADRLTFGPAIAADGSLVDAAAAVDFVRQAEAGVKFRSGAGYANGTLFLARTEEQNFEATTQRFFDREYEAWGLEAEAGFRFGGFNTSGSLTFTKARINKDAIDATVEGNRPRRQAEFVYQLTEQYESEMFTAGASLIGTTSSYAQDSNQLVLPAYAIVNAFLQVRPIDRVQLSINANNLFNSMGITEAEEGSIPTNGIVRARSINGRTISAAVRFAF